jgi:hypothetical protein
MSHWWPLGAVSLTGSYRGPLETSPTGISHCLTPRYTGRSHLDSMSPSNRTLGHGPIGEDHNWPLSPLPCAHTHLALHGGTTDAALSALCQPAVA